MSKFNLKKRKGTEKYSGHINGGCSTSRLTEAIIQYMWQYAKVIELCYSPILQVRSLNGMKNIAWLSCV